MGPLLLCNALIIKLATRILFSGEILRENTLLFLVDIYSVTFITWSTFLISNAPPGCNVSTFGFAFSCTPALYAMDAPPQENPQHTKLKPASLHSADIHSGDIHSADSPHHYHIHILILIVIQNWFPLPYCAEGFVLSVYVCVCVSVCVCVCLGTGAPLVCCTTCYECQLYIFLTDYVQ